MTTDDVTASVPEPSSEEVFQQLVNSDPVFREFTTNAFLLRGSMLSALTDPRRNVDSECGYPETGEIDPEKYRQMYEREPIAARVVEVWPKETWQIQPIVFEVEDEEEETEFELRWSEIATKLRGKSRFKKLKGNPVWEYLRRVDILSGIGHYGVLLIGLDDKQENLEQPAFTPGKPVVVSAPVANLAPTPPKPLPDDKPKKPKGTYREITFLRAFDESTAKIVKYDDNRTSARYGQPEIYELSLANPSDVTLQGTNIPTSTVRVHWTRIHHVADNLTSSEVFSTPRMRPVWNRLLDCKKLYGGSAEMYWRGALPGLSIESNPALGANPKVNETKLRDQLWKYQQGLQRLLVLMGFTAKSLSPQVVDPEKQIGVQLGAICIQIQIPRRVFEGSERGELASSQDSESWDDRLNERRHGYVIPRLIVPFIDRLIDLGVLPEPGEDGFDVEWPDDKELSEDELVTIAVKIVEAMAKYIQGGCDTIMAPMDFLTRVLGFDAEEAEEILEATKEYLEEQNPDSENDIIPGRNPKPPEGFDEQGNPLPDPELPLKVAQVKAGKKPPSGIETEQERLLRKIGGSMVANERLCWGKPCNGPSAESPEAGERQEADKVDSDQQARLDKAWAIDFGKREDGTKKGPGFFGPLKSHRDEAEEDEVMTEVTVGVEIDGKEVEVPTLVPTLTRDEVKHIVFGGEPTDAIVNKAVDFAISRMKQGKPPFIQKGEQFSVVPVAGLRKKTPADK